METKPATPGPLSLLRLLLTWRRHGDPWVHHYLAGRAVLDVGCGSGGFLERSPESRFGIDVSSSLLAGCRRQGLKVARASATALPFPDSSFDGVHCDNVIEHLPPAEAARLVFEVARVLRPGGLAVLKSPLGEGVWNTFSHVRPYPPAAIAKLLLQRKEAYLRGDADFPVELRFEHVSWAGRYFASPVLFALSTLWANLVPWARRYGYVLVLRRP